MERLGLANVSMYDILASGATVAWEAEPQSFMGLRRGTIMGKRATRGCTSNESKTATTRALRLISTLRSWRWTWTRPERPCWYHHLLAFPSFPLRSPSPSSPHQTNNMRSPASFTLLVHAQYDVALILQPPS